MKKVKIITLLMAVVALTACHKGRRQTTIIETTTDNSSMTLEYSGWIKFDSTRTAIQNMAPNAYLKYVKDGKKLIAVCGRDGLIKYKTGSGDETTQLPADSKQLLIQAIKVISDNQAKQAMR